MTRTDRRQLYAATLTITAGLALITAGALTHPPLQLGLLVAAGLTLTIRRERP